MKRVIASVLALSLMCFVSLAARKVREDVVAPTITVSPDPSTLPGVYHVAGAGFDSTVRLVIMLDRFCDDGIQYVYPIWLTTPDASGNFAFDRETEFCTGFYIVEAHPSVNGTPDSVLATATFRVNAE